MTISHHSACNSAQAQYMSVSFSGEKGSFLGGLLISFLRGTGLRAQGLISSSGLERIGYRGEGTRQMES